MFSLFNNIFKFLDDWTGIGILDNLLLLTEAKENHLLVGVAYWFKLRSLKDNLTDDSGRRGILDWSVIYMLASTGRFQTPVHKCPCLSVDTLGC